MLGKDPVPLCRSDRVRSGQARRDAEDGSGMQRLGTSGRGDRAPRPAAGSCSPHPHDVSHAPARPTSIPRVQMAPGDQDGAPPGGKPQVFPFAPSFSVTGALRVQKVVLPRGLGWERAVASRAGGQRPRGTLTWLGPSAWPRAPGIVCPGVFLIGRGPRAHCHCLSNFLGDTRRVLDTF